MSSPAPDRIRHLWRRLSSLDRFALSVAALYALVWLARASGHEPPLATLVQFFFYLFIGGYAVYRLTSLVRRRLLWSLRNRLIVAYLFIAVVPVILLAVMAALLAQLIYQQLGAYLLHEDLQARVEKLQATAEDVMASVFAQTANGSSQAFERPESIPSVTALLTAARIRLPNLALDRELGPAILAQSGNPESSGRERRFAGLVQSGDQVWMVAAVSRPLGAGMRTISLAAPLSPELLDKLVPELGPVQLSITRPPRASDPPEVARLPFVPLRQIRTKGRVTAPAEYWLDFVVAGTTEFQPVLLLPGEPAASRSTLYGFVTSRASLLNRRLFTIQGVVGNFLVQLVLAVGIFFLVIEVAALSTGVNLTRTITRAVDGLYRATQLVQAGDFSHRVRVESRDQLGVLGDSFNAMTSSISTLIEEQRHRQRLENEISIAREVQAQLFPQKLPALPGVELAAVCRAARVVSGDYYDFVQLGPHRIGMALADISGKGISAALLMASLQAAFRSQLLLIPSGAEGLDGAQAVSTADLVTRLNLHLFLNTSDDRYATLFFAVYDSSTRLLHYTNAGHLPPLLLAGEHVQKLETGGMVVGLFDDCVYEQGCVAVQPGSLLVAYSDGITEPENVYGEQFGARRLAAEVLRHRLASPQRLAEQLITAAEEWSAAADEQADDMTVVVARLG